MASSLSYTQPRVIFLPLISANDENPDLARQMNIYGHCLYNQLQPRDVLLTENEDWKSLKCHVLTYASEETQKIDADLNQTLKKIETAVMVISSLLFCNSRYRPEEQKKKYIEAAKFLYDLFDQHQKDLPKLQFHKENLLSWSDLGKAIEEKNRPALVSNGNLMSEIGNHLMDLFVTESFTHKISSAQRSILMRIEACRDERIFIFVHRSVLSDTFLNSLQVPYAIDGNHHSQP